MHYINVGQLGPAVINTLEDEFSGGNPSAKGILDKIESFSFVALLCMMSDILPIFTKFSKTLQFDTLNFDLFSNVLASTKESLNLMLSDDSNSCMPSVKKLFDLPEIENKKVKYQDILLDKSEQMMHTFLKDKTAFINELIKNLEKRFPKEGMQLLAKLDCILNPKKLNEIAAQDLAIYGNEDIKYILDFFNGEAGIDAERCLNDFLAFKTYARSCATRDICQFGEHIINECYELYPDYAILFEFYMTVPLNSVPAERGFSKLNIIKTKYRNRLSTERLNQIMFIAINDTNTDNNLLTKAADEFRSHCDRKK
jgi:hypothetical protein